MSQQDLRTIQGEVAGLRWAHNCIIKSLEEPGVSLVEKSRILMVGAKIVERVETLHGQAVLIAASMGINDE